jgi:hypothetical protein
MADGSRKPIKDVRAGDTVLTTDPATGKSVPHKVIAVHLNRDNALTDLTVRTADGTLATIRTSQNHPFWDSSRQVWVSAGDLQPGAALHNADASEPEVVDVDNRDGVRDMYDLTVEDLHTYYVLAGDSPVLVHNCNSTKLGNDLIRNGEAKPVGVDAQAHHMVPCGSKRAAISRRILGKHGIDVDKAVNGVWMSQKGHAATFRKSYYTWLNGEMKNADASGGKQGVLDFLGELKQTLTDVDQVAHTEFY